MFKVNNKNTRIKSTLLTLTILHTFFSASIVKLEQVNVIWISCQLDFLYFTDTFRVLILP